MPVTNKPSQSYFDELSQALVKQRENSTSMDETMAVVFMGQQYDSIPRELLVDDSIAAVDKYAWQRLYIELQQNRSYFPTYDNLQKLWGNMNQLLSRKTVREVLSRLVISGWLSFRVIRAANGQLVGNVYMLHNTKLDIIDIINQNDESVTELFRTIMSKKAISKSLAMLTYNQVTRYLETKQENDDIYLQIRNNKAEMVITHNIDEIAPSLLQHLKKRLSSKKELSNKTLSSKKELSNKILSSHLELGKNELSSNLEPPIKSTTYESSSSTNSSIYSSTTNDTHLLVIPSNIKERLTDKGLRDINNAIERSNLDVVTVNKIFKFISLKNITVIKNMTAYLVKNIQKAGKGQFNIDPKLLEDAKAIAIPHCAESQASQSSKPRVLVSKDQINAELNKLRVLANC